MRGKVITYIVRVWPNPPTTPREIGSPTHLCLTIRNGAKILSQSNIRIMWPVIPLPSCHLMRMVLMQRGRRGRRRSLITTSIGRLEIRIRRCVSCIISNLPVTLRIVLTCVALVVSCCVSVTLPQQRRLQMIDSFDACFRGGKGDGQPNDNCRFT